MDPVFLTDISMKLLSNHRDSIEPTKCLALPIINH